MKLANVGILLIHIFKKFILFILNFSQNNGGKFKEIRKLHRFIIRGPFFSNHSVPGSTKLLQVKVQVANNNCEEIIKQEIGLKVDLATQICAGGEKG